MAKTYKNLYPQIASFDALYHAWRRARKGKQYKPAAEWDQTAVVRPNVDVPASVVMPNHMHTVVVIHEPTNAADPTDDADHITNANRRGVARHTPTAPKPAYGQPVAGSLGTIVGAYKENTDVPLHVPTPP